MSKIVITRKWQNIEIVWKKETGSDGEKLLYVDGVEYPQRKWYRPELVCRMIWELRLHKMSRAITPQERDEPSSL